jgi:hypothetical protein
MHHPLLFVGCSLLAQDVVGDTFVVGCQIPTEKIVYSDTFTDNPDLTDPIYSTKYGMYEPNCGLDKLLISWGHDEYLVRATLAVFLLWVPV